MKEDINKNIEDFNKNKEKENEIKKKKDDDKKEKYRISNRDVNIINKKYRNFFNLDLEKIKESKEYKNLIKFLHPNVYWHLINASYFYPNKEKNIKKLEKLFNIKSNTIEDIKSDLDSISSLKSIKSCNEELNINSFNDFKLGSQSIINNDINSSSNDFDSNFNDIDSIASDINSISSNDNLNSNDINSISNDIHSISNYNSDSAKDLCQKNLDDIFLFSNLKLPDNNINSHADEDIYNTIEKPDFFDVNKKVNNNLDLLKNKILKYINIFKGINIKNINKIKEKSNLDNEANNNGEDEINYNKYIDENLLLNSSKKSNKIQNKFIDYLHKKNLNNFNSDNGSNNKKQKDEIRCCICNNFDITAGTFLYECKNCGIIVHNLCYGLSDNENPKSFYCDKCNYLLENKNIKKENIQCLFCPNKSGALKIIDVGKTNFFKNKKLSNYIFLKAFIDNNQVNNNNSENMKAFIHISCILFNKYIEFSDFNNKNSIVIKKRLFLNNLEKNTCIICHDSRGYLIKCNKDDCTNYFHIECAREQNYFLEYKYIKNFEYSIFCGIHSNCMCISSNNIKNINNNITDEVINFYKICSPLYNKIKHKNNRHNRSTIEELKKNLKYRNCEFITFSNNTFIIENKKNFNIIKKIKNKDNKSFLNKKNLLINKDEPINDNVYKFIIKVIIKKIIAYLNKSDEITKRKDNVILNNNIDVKHSIYLVKLNDLFKDPLKSIIEKENITMNMIRFIFKSEEDFQKKFVNNIKFNLDNEK